MSVNTYVTCDECRKPIDQEKETFCRPCFAEKIADRETLRGRIEELEDELKDTLLDYNAAQEKINRLEGSMVKAVEERIEERRTDREIIDGLRGQVEAYEQTLREAGSR